ncbi:hypothetical protein MIR68_012259 [Amoeboaphelidium protococcarum]|nr:hypothetical protein MIR68_012259 [Amoeboaphelidium protococcarum]
MSYVSHIMQPLASSGASYCINAVQKRLTTEVLVSCYSAGGKAFILSISPSNYSALAQVYTDSVANRRLTNMVLDSDDNIYLLFAQFGNFNKQYAYIQKLSNNYVLLGDLQFGSGVQDNIFHAAFTSNSDLIYVGSTGGSFLGGTYRGGGRDNICGLLYKNMTLGWSQQLGSTSDEMLNQVTTFDGNLFAAAGGINYQAYIVFFLSNGLFITSKQKPVSTQESLFYTVTADSKYFYAAGYYYSPSTQYQEGLICRYSMSTFNLDSTYIIRIPGSGSMVHYVTQGLFVDDSNDMLYSVGVDFKYNFPYHSYFRFFTNSTNVIDSLVYTAYKNTAPLSVVALRNKNIFVVGSGDNTADPYYYVENFTYPNAQPLVQPSVVSITRTSSTMSSTNAVSLSVSSTKTVVTTFTTTSGSVSTSISSSTTAAALSTSSKLPSPNLSTAISSVSSQVESYSTQGSITLNSSAKSQSTSPNETLPSTSSPTMQSAFPVETLPSALITSTSTNSTTLISSVMSSASQANKMLLNTTVGSIYPSSSVQSQSLEQLALTSTSISTTLSFSSTTIREELSIVTSQQLFTATSEQSSTPTVTSEQSSTLYSTSSIGVSPAINLQSVTKISLSQSTALSSSAQSDKVINFSFDLMQTSSSMAIGTTMNTVATSAVITQASAGAFSFGQNLFTYAVIAGIVVFLMLNTVACLLCVRRRRYAGARKVPFVSTPNLSQSMTQMSRQTDTGHMSAQRGVTSQHTGMTAYSTTMTAMTAVATSHELSIPAYMRYEFGLDFRAGKTIAKNVRGKICHGEILNAQQISHANGLQVVVKFFEFNVEDPKDQQWYHAFQQEVSVLHMLRDCPYICKFIGYSDNPSCIIMKLYGYGSLRDLILKNATSNQIYNKSLIVSMLTQSCLALSHVHKFNFAHCDIKLENIMIDFNEFGQMIPILIDFGISAVVDRQQLSVAAFKVSTLKGLSIEYASPEMFAGFRGKYQIQPYELQKADIYAMGCITFNFLTRTRIKQRFIYY